MRSPMVISDRSTWAVTSTVGAAVACATRNNPVAHATVRARCFAPQPPPHIFHPRLPTVFRPPAEIINQGLDGLVIIRPDQNLHEIRIGAPEEAFQARTFRLYFLAEGFPEFLAARIDQNHLARFRV